MQRYVKHTRNGRVFMYTDQFAKRIGDDLEFCDPPTPEVKREEPLIDAEVMDFTRMRTKTLQRRMAAKGVEFVDRKQAIEYLKEHG